MKDDSLPPVIHPSACVDARATLGGGVRVGPFAIIEGGAIIGPHTSVMGHAYVTAHATLGRECVIHPNAVVGGDPQDMSYRGGEERALLGDRVTLFEGVTIHRATQAGTATRVGNDCFFMANSHVAHDCVVGNNVIVANNTAFGGHVHVADRAIFSGHAGVHQFARIGKLAMLSALTLAYEDVPPFVTAAGPRAEVRGINRVGMQRAGYDESQRRRVLTTYQRFFRALSEAEGLANIEEDASKYPEVTEIFDFIRSKSRRGLCRPPAGHPLSERVD